ncbi:peptidylprolyl isomerase [Streptomyces niger]|uniref:peptidylprolyl isomerase n=1 Tax=Streptomyces niger TaxID=66373 RepID=UPI00069B7259|nr:peptidylprolyl isomerase [Streptomyces niger]
MVKGEQRRKQLARQKYERQARRRAETRQKTKRRNVIIASVLAVVVAAGATAYATAGLVGADNKNDAKASAADRPKDPCAAPAKGEPSKKQWKKEPKLTVDGSASYTAKLATTCGDISLKLDAEKAPHTVNSFDFLTRQGYFDHSPCHRLVDSDLHVLQCGDPTGTGQGTPGYTIPDENLKDPRLKGGVYPAGTVAMANRYDGRSEKTRNTGGSQFFLVFQDSKLPANYTPFGTITQGMDVLKKIAKAGYTTDPQTQNTAPNATVVIDRARITKS